MKGKDIQKIKDLVEFPVVYTFKIIGDNNESFAENLKKIFADKKVLSLKWEKSKTNKYISASVVVEIDNADELASIYKDIQKLEGLKYFL